MQRRHIRYRVPDCGAVSALSQRSVAISAASYSTTKHVLPGGVSPHVQTSSFWSSIIQGRTTGLASPLYPCGCQLLGERRAPPWKRAGEARRTLMSTSPASDHYSSLSHDFRAPPSPVQRRLVGTHYLLSGTPTHTTTHPSGSYRRRLRLGPASFMTPSRARRGNRAEKALVRGAVRSSSDRPWLAWEAVAIPASTRCFDFQVWAVGRRS